MNLTEKQILDDLKAGKHLPVYLITGEENYFIDVLSDYFENNVVDESFRDFDQVVVYGHDLTNMHQVVSLAKQYPMMSPVRLVLVKEAQALPIKEWEPLVNYLAEPQPQTILVLCYRLKSYDKKFDKRTRVYKAIDKIGGFVDRKRLYDSQLPEWIGSYCHQHGFPITKSASMLIADSVGNELGKITNELGKVFISLQPGDTINEEVLERQIGISKDFNNFELQKAIARKDVVRCNRIINYFAANPKEHPLAVLVTILYTFFIRVMIYHQLTDKSEASNALKVSDSFISDFAVAAANYPLGKLASCIGFLNETDLRSKGVKNAGTVSDGELMKELIFKILH